MHSGKVLDDVATKGLTIETATGGIPHSRGGKGRDIITEFHFRRGAWPPVPVSPSVLHESTDVSPDRDRSRQEDPSLGSECLEHDGKFVIPTEVQRSMSAMGCPLARAAPSMPLLPPELASQLKAEHREKNPMETPLPFNAMVARPVSRSERDSNPAALEAVAK